MAAGSRRRARRLSLCRSPRGFCDCCFARARREHGSRLPYEAVVLLAACDGRQVLLDTVPSGLVIINVVGKAVTAATGSQPYALVVLGQISGTLASTYNPAYDAVSHLCHPPSDSLHRNTRRRNARSRRCVSTECWSIRCALLSALLLGWPAEQPRRRVPRRQRAGGPRPVAGAAGARPHQPAHADLLPDHHHGPGARVGQELRVPAHQRHGEHAPKGMPGAASRGAVCRRRRTLACTD